MPTDPLIVHFWNTSSSLFVLLKSVRPTETAGNSFWKLSHLVTAGFALFRLRIA